MKHKVLKSIICSLLIVAMLSAPMSALASSKVAYLVKVATTDSSNKVRIRAGSAKRGGNGDATIIGSVKTGSYVLHWGEKSGQMLKVMTPNGLIGYIFKDNVKSYGAMNKDWIYLTKASTAVYKRSGSGFRRTGTVGKNKPVVVMKKWGGWAMVKSMSGKTAYVKTSSLTKAF